MDNVTDNITDLQKEILSLKAIIDGLRSENNSFLYGALSNFQSEMPLVQKNVSSFGKQKYADFAEIVRISRPILCKWGLSVTQTFELIDNNRSGLRTTLCHKTGQCIFSLIPLITSETLSENKDTGVKGLNVLQELGKSITYLRRYSYMSILGIAVDEE